MRVAFVFFLAVPMFSGCVTVPDPVATTKELEMTFVQVPGGTFEMGCGFWQSDCAEDEKPAHTVTLRPFAIGKQEVTQAQWVAVMGSNPSGFVLCGGHCPVEQVSWDDIQLFLLKLNARGTDQYRLPTEAEWEYTCRSGGKSERYCGGNAPEPLAWFDNKAGTATSPVGQKAANGLGLYDMSGNVWEWVEDGYCKQFYSSADAKGPNPMCAENPDRLHVLRGGSWFNPATDMRSTGRNRNKSNYRNVNLGFRLVRQP